MKYLKVLAATCALVGASSAFAGTIDFENAPTKFWFNQGAQDLGGFYQGVTFSAGAQITPSSGTFPAHSGRLELFDANPNIGTISMTFSAAQTDVSFWYSTAFGITVQAFDKNGVSLGSTDLSAAVQNSNKLFDFGFGNISKVTITDDVGAGIGNFFTIDDLTASGVNGQPVPDVTGTFGLLGVAGLGLVALRRKLAVQ